MVDAASVSSLDVEFLFHLEFDTGSEPPVMITGGPHGNRVVVTAAGGRFEGPRLRGTVSPPGGDWVTMAPDGTLRIDVRALLRTDDGADIFMTYTGVGANVDGELRLRTAPRFETDERYGWLNQIQAVGLGSLTGAGVAYDVYRLR